jgi:hypothetical protein
MIKIENVTINGKPFVKTYSDKGLYIKKVGTTEEYIEAVDIPTKNYTYKETDKEIPKEKDNATQTK